MKRNLNDAVTILNRLSRFIGESQRLATRDLLYGEEGDFYIAKVSELCDTIFAMPVTYGTEDQGDRAVAHLHYFARGCDWWITEQDMYTEQSQAFGLACLNGDWEMAEVGYISIREILDAGAELDYYWEPKTLGEIKRSRECNL